MTTAPPLNSRFTLLGSPIKHPGKCCVCGTVQGPVIDLGITVLGYGVVYFWVSCLTEAATGIGMVSEESVRGLEEAAEQSFNAYLAERELQVVTNEWYYNVVVAISSLHAVALGSGVRSDIETPESAGTEVPDDVTGAAEKPKRRSKPAGQDSDAPVDKGPASVPTDSSDEPAGEFSF